jgi:phosphoenolpyruvate synthase/pyruvate phosphate dikinase
VIPLAAADQPARYGGKASGLARLIAWGFEVPEGVALAWDEVDTIAAGGAVPHVDPAGPWAVRSSAVGEDTAGASYAGQHLTVTGVGPEGLRTAITDVRASGSAPGPLAYRAQRGIVAPVRMGVVVQHLVAADISVLAFGVHPVTGLAGVVIEAAPGAGERLVQGEVTPDHWALEPDGRVRERREGDEPTGLADRSLAQIATLVDRISRLAGCPQDVEMALAAGRIWTLQARPVTVR